MGAELGTPQFGGGEEASWTRLEGAGDEMRIVDLESRVGFGCDSLGQETTQFWLKRVTGK